MADQVVFYVSRESLSSTKKVRKFIGLATINGQPYRLPERIWNNGLFPHRISIEPVEEKVCDVTPLIHKLRFIKNTKNWGSAFLPGIIRIPPEDFAVIRDYMR